MRIVKPRYTGWWDGDALFRGSIRSDGIVMLPADRVLADYRADTINGPLRTQAMARQILAEAEDAFIAQEFDAIVEYQQPERQLEATIVEAPNIVRAAVRRSLFKAMKEVLPGTTVAVSLDAKTVFFLGDDKKAIGCVAALKSDGAVIIRKEPLPLFHDIRLLS